MLQAAALAPMTVLADALAIGASRGRFEYGWVRGTGSAAFIAGTLPSFRRPVCPLCGTAFWGMAALCALALPFALVTRD